MNAKKLYRTLIYDNLHTKNNRNKLYQVVQIRAFMERRVPYHVLRIVRKDTATSSLERVLVVLWDSGETTVMRVSAYIFYSYLSLK